MNTVPEIIEAAGGPKAVADLCAVKAPSLKKWRASGRIPPKHWPKLVGLGGIDYSTLEAVNRAKAAQ